MTVGQWREWLLGDDADEAALTALSPSLTPEMVAAVSKLMRNQDLIAVARKIHVVTRFRSTIGLPGRLAVRLQPNHPTDDPLGIAASILDGLLMGCGDAVIGINPASDSLGSAMTLLRLIDDLRQAYAIPTQSCVLTHVTNSIAAVERGAPVDLMFQSIAGSEEANRGFGIDLALLKEAREAALSLGRGSVGDNVMYFETGQGSALSAEAHHGVDQQTMEVRAYAVARAFDPLLVNSVVGFIGPEYLYDGKQIIRAGLEDHFCGKLMGVPMGVDVCYTNHAEADQDDMDTLLTLLGVAGVNFVMGVPGADDVMLNYQSTSFHDALYIRRALGLRPAPRVRGMAGQDGLARQRGHHSSRRAGRLGRHTRPARRACMSDALGPADACRRLRQATQARIGLGHAGAGLPTAPMLDFQMAHAMARDAVHAALDEAEVARDLSSTPISVASRAADRVTYLQRPDLGRRLDAASRDRLGALAGGPWGAVIVIADGLSATATAMHGAAVATALLSRIKGWRVAPLVIAHQARVALADEVGEILGAAVAVILIGERPGLSSPDSLGAYLTWGPRVGRVDSERNCVSNIRPPHGLSHAAAADKLAWLMREARTIGSSGVTLKDDRPSTRSIE